MFSLFPFPIWFVSIAYLVCHIWFVSISYLVCHHFILVCVPFWFVIFGLCPFWPVALASFFPFAIWFVTLDPFGLSPLGVSCLAVPPFSSRFLLGRFLFPSLNDAPLRLNGAYPRSPLGRRRDSIETPGRCRVPLNTQRDESHLREKDIY
ncbi:hypothetical protein TNCV_2053701 [Trichonephila clavipes]|nr:hypothetical protein TNCV_2053701 [Trichonephila clavipes]